MNPPWKTSPAPVVSTTSTLKPATWRIFPSTKAIAPSGPSVVQRNPQVCFCSSVSAFSRSEIPVKRLGNREEVITKSISLISSGVRGSTLSMSITVGIPSSLAHLAARMAALMSWPSRWRSLPAQTSSLTKLSHPVHQPLVSPPEDRSVAGSSLDHDDA